MENEQGLIEADLFIEELAQEFHDRWVDWAERIIDTEVLSEERMERWHEYLCDYDLLDEKAKDIDRDLARVFFLTMISKYPKLQEVFKKKEEKG